MIHSLLVENIALIDKLDMEFAEGLNILTGETGAGKSIIVDSMNLALGERADREMIRGGRESARVEALLYVDPEELMPVFEEYGIRPEEELAVTRELSGSGKNACRINGGIVNLSTLKGFMDHAADLVGQHEHQSLLHTRNHLALIDSFGGGGIAKLKREADRLLSEWKRKNEEISRLGGDEAGRRNVMELLEFQVAELERAGLSAGEMEELRRERELLGNARHIASTLDHCYRALYAGEEGGSVLSGLKYCMDAMAQLAGLAEEYRALAAGLEEAYYTLEEAARDIGAGAGRVVFDEERQNELEERIEFLGSLRRKYNAADEAGLLACLDGAKERLDRLSRSAEITQRLEEDAARLKKELYRLSGELSARRHTAAARLEGLVIKELAELGMKGAVFEARFAPLPSAEQARFGPGGLDDVEFFISTNPGEAPRPLSRIASGGEISRIMLAFKSIAADHIPTVIFDEIDTGISGHMAHVVAEKMASIAKKRQVICVTHLAQIAAMADRNFLIEKRSGGGGTNTQISRLDGAERLDEIARLSGGIHSEHAISHARELLANALVVKSRL